MFKELVEQNRCIFADRVQNWQEAIRLSCRPLIEQGIVYESYSEELIENVNKHGPYIVLMPGLAMPHTMAGSQGVKCQGISFLKVKEPVSFDPDDPDKDASVFFTLAVKDSSSHLKTMRRLFKILSNEDLFEELLNVSCTDDLLMLNDKYNLQQDDLDL